MIESLNSKEGKKTFDLHEQKSNVTGKTVFYHVKTAKYEKSEDKDVEEMRLYINCNRENVATIAGEMLSKMQNDNLYLKFSSDEQLSTRERSEAIVVYTDTKNAPNVINNIKQIYSENPRLFEKSRNINPFLKTDGGIIGYAPEPEIDEYEKRDGKIEKIGKSYNSFLAKALEESFIRTAREHIAKSQELTSKTRRNYI